MFVSAYTSAERRVLRAAPAEVKGEPRALSGPGASRGSVKSPAPVAAEAIWIDWREKSGATCEKSDGEGVRYNFRLKCRGFVTVDWLLGGAGYINGVSRQ